MEDKVLYHHGVMGMRWGHRKDRLAARNVRLAKRANKFDKKSAVAYKRSERLHARRDLGSANRAARRSGRLAIKATKYRKKAAKASDPFEKVKYENKAAKAAFRSSRWKISADEMSKKVGYSRRPLALAVKATRYTAKADKARMKITRNTRIMAKLDKKAAEMSSNSIDLGKKLVHGEKGE